MSVLIGADLHGIDDPEGIASVLEHDLQRGRGLPYTVKQET